MRVLWHDHWMFKVIPYVLGSLPLASCSPDKSTSNASDDVITLNLLRKSDTTTKPERSNTPHYATISNNILSKTQVLDFLNQRIHEEEDYLDREFSSRKDFLSSDIKNLENLIVSLEASIDNESRTLSLEKVDEQTSAQQESIMWQERISFLKDEIRYQENNIEIARQDLRNLLDSPESERGQALKSTLLNEIGKHGELRERFASVLRERESDIRQSTYLRNAYTKERQLRLQGQLIQLQVAKSELDGLNVQYQTIQREESELRQAIQNLLKQRETLLAK